MFQSKRTPSFSSSPASTDVVEVHVTWGDVVLDVIELSPPRAFYIGDPAASSLPVDLVVPGLDDARAPLVTVDGGEVLLHVPPGGESDALQRITPLKRGEFTRVTLGALRLTVGLAEREERCPRTTFGTDKRVAGFFAASFAACAALVGSFAFFTPNMNLTDDEGADREAQYLMMAYLDAAAEREQKEPPPSDGSGGGEGAPLPPDGAKGESGKMGKREAVAQERRASGTEAGSTPRAATTRSEELAMAQNFGMIGMLASGAAAPTHAPWEDSGVGNVAYAGGLFGSEFGEQNGAGGLGLTGIGEGGGFHGDRIGLGGIGTCGENGHCGLGGKGEGLFGLSQGRQGGKHVAVAPRLRMGNTSVEGGRLPASAIQRVVQQNFGRFRSCYEAGLRTNPNLTGRVTARFVIARDGSVATVASGGSDLPDSSVVSCVLRTYGSLSFPPPTDGIVKVSYPLMFSPA